MYLASTRKNTEGKKKNSEKNSITTTQPNWIIVHAGDLFYQQLKQLQQGEPTYIIIFNKEYSSLTKEELDQLVPGYSLHTMITFEQILLPSSTKNSNKGNNNNNKKQNNTDSTINKNKNKNKNNSNNKKKVNKQEEEDDEDEYENENVNHFMCLGCTEEGLYIYDDLLSLAPGGYQGGFLPNSSPYYPKNLQFFFQHVPIAILKKIGDEKKETKND